MGREEMENKSIRLVSQLLLGLRGQVYRLLPISNTGQDLSDGRWEGLGEGNSLPSAYITWGL